jgi:hypothetical protein
MEIHMEQYFLQADLGEYVIVFTDEPVVLPNPCG